MNGYELCTALNNRQRVYGTLIVSPSPKWPPQIVNLGLDFVFIDREHVAIDRTTLSWMCRTYSALGLAPVVRITQPDPAEASSVLDAGAEGIIAPYVETAEQVQALRGAVKLRPIKGKKLEQIIKGNAVGLEPELKSYMSERNQAALIVNIESVPAMESLDEILAVPQLDGVLIGPHDLSCSLGIPEKYDHPQFDRAVRHILRMARQKNIAAGIHYMMGDIEQEIRWIQEEDANLIIHRADLIVFVTQMRRQIALIRAELGDAGKSLEDSAINI
jgi:2-keto-3-deoxy-L-rhamnonate aldolase RhmA